MTLVESQLPGPLKIIVIDDDEDHGDLIRRALAGPESPCRTATVSIFTDAGEALASLPLEGPVAILCDNRMPGGNGVDWLADFVRADVGPVILVTGSGDERVAAAAFRLGAADYVVKHTIFEDPSALYRAISEGTRRFHLEKTNRELSRQLRRANRELQDRNDVLSKVSQTAHRFVDDVAHEFRTPLAVIMEFASILDDGLGGDLTDPQREYVNFISSATRDLASLVDDFLDSSKIRARSLRMDRRRCQLSDIIAAVWPILESRAASRAIHLIEETEPDLPPVFVDAEKVGRTVINLVINAIKFSARGSEVIIRTERDPNGWMTVNVVDSGPGLPPEEVDRIFERFQQVAAVQQPSTKGFGLGLNIAKELIALNFGEMGVESAVGSGSTFFFRLPPAEPDVVVNRYTDIIRDVFDAEPISVLRVTAATGVDAGDIRELLAGCCYPMDLVVESSDRRSVMLAGMTREPERWFRRLSGIVPATAAESIRVLGTWHVDEAADHVREALAIHPKERAA